jgi:hypothetical protein
MHEEKALHPGRDSNMLPKKSKTVSLCELRRYGTQRAGTPMAQDKHAEGERPHKAEQELGAGVGQKFMDSKHLCIGTPSVDSASAPCRASALAAPCLSCIVFDGTAVFGVRRPCAALDFCGAELPTLSRTTVCADSVRKTKRQRTAALQRSLPLVLRKACRDQIAHWAPLICAKLQSRAGVRRYCCRLRAQRSLIVVPLGRDAA